MGLTPQFFATPHEAVQALGALLKGRGKRAEIPSWQATQAPAAMREILDVGFRAAIPESVEDMRRTIKPHLPWADEHFDERVSGIPSNPGESYKVWPFFVRNERDKEFRHVDEKFTHTYQERIWPKQAGDDHITRAADYINHGIRYALGDLNDLVEMLRREPLTRQAYLPIWFPEDTGAVHGGRVPCTLGYLFTFRSGFLHCTYYIRSCDFFRHFRDDIYFACRLTKWILDQLDWEGARTGVLSMYIGNLHCFDTENEVRLLP